MSRKSFPSPVLFDYEDEEEEESFVAGNGRGGEIRTRDLLHPKQAR
jgi:hypothetical protein